MKKIFLIGLLLSTHALAQELTLHFVPSPLGMDWSSPSAIAKSALKNRLSFKPRFMGHVFVELKCGGSHDYTGMVGKKFDYLNQLLIEERGLGILYHSFAGGLEEKDAVIREIQEFQSSGYSNFAKFIINDKQCARVSAYLKEYREKNVGRHYGLANRPRFGEGAGCTAFGVSFLDVLGILDQDMKESWSQTVNIPLKLAGPPLQSTGVGLFKVMFGAGSWAQESEPHQKLTFWDPDLMSRWVKKKISSKHGGFTVLKIGNSEGVVIDKSHFPAPEGPIWLQRLDPENEKQTAKN